MIYELDKETIDFLCKHKITFNQFSICLLIHKKNAAAIIQIGAEIGLIGDCMIPVGKDREGKPKYKTELKDLIDREFIEIINPSHGNDLDNFKVTDKFKDGFVTNIELASEEFFETYPKSVIVNGTEFPARSCDFEEMSVAYLKAIKGSIKRHRAIIEQLQTEKQSNPYAKMNIMKYIGGRCWENNTETTKVKTRGY